MSYEEFRRMKHQDAKRDEREPYPQHHRYRRGQDEEEEAWDKDHRMAHAMHRAHKHHREYDYDYHDDGEESDDYIENPYEYEMAWVSHHHSFED